MPLPMQKSIELPLLYEIEQAGGSAKPADIYERVAKHFSLLTEEDRRLVNPSGGNSKFENRVQFARNTLAGKGELDRAVYGVWKITQAGRERLKKEWPSDFKPVYTDNRKLKPSGGRDSPAVGSESDAGRPLSDVPVFVPPPPQDGSPDVRSQLQARIQALTPRHFEHLVGAFLRAHGLADVVITAYSQDGGIDGHCAVPFVGVKVGFQAKRFAATQSVGAPVMQQFKGSLTYNRYERGIFVTTSDFTQGAVEVAEGPGVPVVLVNGRQLVERMLGMGLGVKTIPVIVQEVDEDFFGNLAG